MASPQKIVVGIDGSLAARIALDWAVTEARAHGRTVHVVNAWSAGAATEFAWLPAGEPGSVTSSCLLDATVPVVVVPAAYANGDTDEPGHSHGRADEALPRPSGAHQPRP